jgi:hypothetical protein
MGALVTEKLMATLENVGEAMIEDLVRAVNSGDPAAFSSAARASFERRMQLLEDGWRRVVRQRRTRPR